MAMALMQPSSVPRWPRTQCPLWGATVDPCARLGLAPNRPCWDALTRWAEYGIRASTNGHPLTAARRPLRLFVVRLAFRTAQPSWGVEILLAIGIKMGGDP